MPSGTENIVVINWPSKEWPYPDIRYIRTYPETKRLIIKEVPLKIRYRLEAFIVPIAGEFFVPINESPFVGYTVSADETWEVGISIDLDKEAVWRFWPIDQGQDYVTQLKKGIKLGKIQ